MFRQGSRRKRNRTAGLRRIGWEGSNTRTALKAEHYFILNSLGC